MAFNSAHGFGSQISSMSSCAASAWLLAARWPGASSNSSARGRPGDASRLRRRKAWQCACSRVGRRNRSRGPVRRLIAPNKTRVALHPVMAPGACSPRSAHARRKTGKRRRTVSSSLSSMVCAGRWRSRRTIAPFFAPGGGRAPRKHSGAAYSVTPWLACAAAGSGA